MSAAVKASKRALRAASLALLASVAALAPGAARAAGPVAPVAFADLPEATIPPPPNVRSAPDRIEPSESVEGWILAPSMSKRMATISATDGRCFLDNRMDLTSRPMPREPMTAVSGMPTSMRSEKLVVDGGAAHLEIVDGWVDPETRGARLVSRTVVPLAKLAEAEGVTLYAFRDGDTVDVVTPARASLRYQDPDVPLGMTTCGHARSELRAKVGSGESMEVTFQVVTKDSGAPAAEQQPLAARFARFVVGVSRSTLDPAPVLDVDVAWVSDEPAPSNALGFVVPQQMPPEAPMPQMPIQSTRLMAPEAPRPFPHAPKVRRRVRR